MTLDVTALRESFELVVDRRPDLTAAFYEIFFARYPQVRPMFPSGMQRQQKMLAQALALVVDHLEDPAWLGSTLRGLGAKHVGYGVTREMYDWVGECLLATLALAAGDDWSPRLERAWADAYGAVRDGMLAGAAEAEAAAAASSVAVADQARKSA